MAILDKTKDNDYTHVRRVEDGRGITYLKARCQNEECGHHEEYVRLTGGKTTISQEWADRLFRGKKWLVGKDRAHDTCPICIQRMREERAKRQEELLSTTTFSPPTPSAAPQQATAPEIRPTTHPHEKSVVVPLDVKPSDPTEEFVLEFLKSENLIIERTDRPGFNRYIPGWTDDRVLFELQKTIPSLDRTRLKKIRQKFFGISRPRTPIVEMVAAGRSKTANPERYAAAAATAQPAPIPEPTQSLQEFADQVQSTSVQHDAPQPVEHREAMKAPEGTKSDDKVEVRMAQIEEFVRAMMVRVNELTEDNDKLQEEHNALYKTCEGIVREHATLINRVYDLGQQLEPVVGLGQQLESLRKMVQVLEHRQPDAVQAMAPAPAIPEETLKSIEKLAAFQKAVGELVKSLV